MSEPKPKEEPKKPVNTQPKYQPSKPGEKAHLLDTERLSADSVKLKTDAPPMFSVCNKSSAELYPAPLFYLRGLAEQSTDPADRCTGCFK